MGKVQSDLALMMFIQETTISARDFVCGLRKMFMRKSVKNFRMNITNFQKVIRALQELTPLWLKEEWAFV